MTVNIEQFTLMRVDFVDDDAIINGYLSAAENYIKDAVERMAISMLNLLLLTVTKLLSMPAGTLYTHRISMTETRAISMDATVILLLANCV